MSHHDDDYSEHSVNNLSGVLTGLLIGGLAGALAMLFFAPQSGEKTRTQVQQKSIELVDRAGGMIDETWSQVRKDGRKFNKQAHHKVKEFKTLVVDQLEHVSDAARAGKKAVLRA